MVSKKLKLSNIDWIALNSKSSKREKGGDSDDPKIKGTDKN